MLFVGDDWAEDHHDVEILDSNGKRLGRARLPEGMDGMTRLHALIAEHLDDADLDPETGMLAVGRVVVGIETDRGPWGCRADRGRVSGVRDQPDVGGPLPGTAHHVGGEVRPR